MAPTLTVAERLREELKFIELDVQLGRPVDMRDVLAFADECISLGEDEDETLRDELDCWKEDCQKAEKENRDLEEKADAFEAAYELLKDEIGDQIEDLQRVAKQTTSRAVKEGICGNGGIVECLERALEKAEAKAPKPAKAVTSALKK